MLRLAVGIAAALSSPLAHAETTTRAPPEESAGSLRSKADEALISGRTDEALSLLGKAIGLEPLNERNLYKRARLPAREAHRGRHRRPRRRVKARAEYEAALASRAKALASVGRCAEAGEDWKVARLVAKKDAAKRDADAGAAAARRRDDLEALELRGLAYYRLADHAMAKTHWQQALRSDPEHEGCKAGYKKLRALTKKDAAGDAARDAGDDAGAIAHWAAAAAVDASHDAFNVATRLKIARAHVLGVARDASSREIKKAYRDAALKYHPDKIAAASAARGATNKFQEIATACEVLSDDETRAKYDAGEDVTNPNAGNQQQQGGGFRFPGTASGGGGAEFRFG
ncbi:hypothetical protein JL720_3078 [Aureococcus anophagefferens]|nr:hypothetical protein JL720_3078 [Aureococcus anophagefferens]